MALLRLRTFQQRLIALGVVLTVIPLLALSLAQWKWHSELVRRSEADSERQSRGEISRAVEFLEASCQALSASLKSHTQSQMGSAESLLAERGGAHVIRGWNQPWTARDQDTGQIRQARVPVMVVGEARKGPDSANRFVEAVSRATGAHATLFQRLNAEGDMLRIATTVKLAKGQSAAGTMVTARREDSTPNPVIAAVLAGRQFVGRAKVGDAWSITAYTPLVDEQGLPFGMLFVGAPETAAAEKLRALAKAMRLGRSGVATVMASSELAGRKDPLAERLLSTAHGLAVGQEAHFRAAGVAGITRDGREHEFTVRHSREWDWVLIAAVPLDELLETAARIAQEGRDYARKTAGLAGGTLLVAWLALWVAARRWAAGIAGHVHSLRQASRSIMGAAKRVRSAGVRVDEVNSRQSAAVETVTGHISLLSKEGAAFSASATEFTRAAAEVRESACAGSEKTRNVAASMIEIDQAGRGVAKTMSVMNEIAMQTNLLALNAAVEAARAGQAGLGFAVVADGVRALAARASQAAQETSTLIQGALGASKRGAALVDDASASLGSIEERSTRLDELAGRLSEQARAQTSRLNGIRETASGVERSGRETLEASEAARQASGELAAEARRLHTTAEALSALFLTARG